MDESQNYPPDYSQQQNNPQDGGAAQTASNASGVPPVASVRPEEVGGSLALVQTVAQRLINGLSDVILGQPELIEMLVVGLLADGHMLLEGIPGTAKTTLVKTLAQLAGVDFRRVQLTPDMLPAEIIGTTVYDLHAKAFSFKRGPVFTDLLLADEINRTPPKTQSALLESMEEYQVTADGVRHELPSLFTVIATLNPVEFEGTYPLPEAQLDRFMMKIHASYPVREAEMQMMAMHAAHPNARFIHKNVLPPVTSRDEVMRCRELLAEVQVEECILDYILNIVHDTRKNPNIELGCSPRAALAMMRAARAHAAIYGSAFVTPDNVKAVAAAVVRHRLILSAQAELDGLTADSMVKQTLNKVPVPR